MAAPLPDTSFHLNMNSMKIIFQPSSSNDTLSFYISQGGPET